MMGFSIIAQLFLLLFFLARDKNDGGKDLFRRQQWKVLDVCIVLALFQAYPLYFAIPAYILFDFGVDLQPFFYDMTNQALMFYAEIICLVLLFMTFKLKFRQPVTILGIGKAGLKKDIALGLCIGMVAFLTVDGLRFLLLAKRFEIELSEMITKSKTLSDYLFLFGGVVFLGPLVEEIVFRGILYSPLRKKYGPVKAIIIASLFFGIGHPSFLNAFLYGLFLTALYETTESIISTFVAHSAINVLVVASALYYVR